MKKARKQLQSKKKIIKPELIKLEYYDYHQCRDYIEEKYNCKIRDYAGRFENHDYSKPYQDFWHFLVDELELYNGAMFWMNIPELKVKALPWQNEILDMFQKEFGDQPYFKVYW